MIDSIWPLIQFGCRVLFDSVGARQLGDIPSELCEHMEQITRTQGVQAVEQRSDHVEFVAQAAAFRFQTQLGESVLES